jgi:hypothetical protein
MAEVGMRQPLDGTEYQLLTYPGAALVASVVREPGAIPEVRLFGNRGGVLSLANVMLWFHARGFEREFLPVTQLPFVKCEGSVSLVIRLVDQASAPGRSGQVHALDDMAQFEWRLPDEDLQAVALSMHRLACFWEHEYELYPLSDDQVGDARIHARLTDTSPT